MGHAKVFVLDGGLKKWIAEGHPVEAGWREPEHGEFKAHPAPELIADLAAVRARWRAAKARWWTPGPPPASAATRRSRGQACAPATCRARTTCPGRSWCAPTASWRRRRS